MQVRLARHAAIGTQLAQVDLVTLDERAPTGSPHVIDRRGAGHPEQPRLQRARALEATERLVGTDHGIPSDVLRVAATHDRRHVGDHAAPLLVDDGREGRVEIGGR
jgi:hypothetical protein